MTATTIGLGEYSPTTQVRPNFGRFSMLTVWLRLVLPAFVQIPVHWKSLSAASATTSRSVTVPSLRSLVRVGGPALLDRAHHLRGCFLWARFPDGPRYSEASEGDIPTSHFSGSTDGRGACHRTRGVCRCSHTHHTTLSRPDQVLLEKWRSQNVTVVDKFTYVTKTLVVCRRSSRTTILREPESLSALTFAVHCGPAAIGFGEQGRSRPYRRGVRHGGHGAGRTNWLARAGTPRPSTRLPLAHGNA